MAQYESLAIANEFIKRSLRYGVPITHMKLQKLIFFAHGWHLALAQTPLINEPVQAWQYGPVVPSIYFKFRNYGANAIDKEASTLDPYNYGVSWVNQNVPENDFQTQQLLDWIWNSYGKLDAMQLSNMTHESGTPWEKTCGCHCGTLPCNLEISDDEIKITSPI